MKKHKSNFFRLFLSTVRLKNFLISFIPKARKRLFVFLVFLALSTILWLFRALDEPYTASIDYPVKYMNLPKNKMLTSSPPEFITINVKGNGYTILNNKITSPVLTLDVNNFSFYTQSDGILSVYLTSRLAKELLTHELNKGKHRLEIITIAPDTLYFSFAKTQNISKPVKVIFAEVDNLLEQQHILNGPIIISPDSVFVYGPSTITDTLKYIYTKPLKLLNLKDSAVKKIGLIQFEGIKMNVNKVEVIIPVDKYTETKFDVPLNSKNVPDSISMVIFPRNVTITFLVALSNLKMVSKTDFHPFIDFTDISTLSNSTNQKLTVQTGTVPPYAQMVKINPNKVDYLIEFNHVESRNNRGNR